MSKKYKKKIKWNNIIILLITFGLCILIIICSANIIKWAKDSNDTNKKIQTIIDDTPVIEVEDTQQTETIEDEEINKNDPYWKFIDMNLIDVDFKDLKKQNNETAGWIQVNGTNVNFPYVQTTDNNYYLTHSFDKSNNTAGWAFLDYRNNKDEYDKNTIIYAHSRLLNKSMFSTLKKTLKNEWLNDSENHIIKISTEQHNSLWQIFSVYRIEPTIDYLKINFNDNTEFLDLISTLINRSVYNFNTTINENDKILTLSTCYNDNERLAIHAKLIKNEKK